MSVTFTNKVIAGEAPLTSPRIVKMTWPGDAVYPDGGTAAILAAVRTAALDGGLVLVDVIPGDCGVYRPVLTETPASVTSAATFPTADQDTNTITYILNGAAEATLTLAGAHTSAAHLAASFNAETGVHAYVDVAGQVIVKTDRTGTAADLQITGGTANAVYLFPTTANVGTADKLLKVLTETNVDAGFNTITTDLSGTEFEASFICE